MKAPGEFRVSLGALFSSIQYKPKLFPVEKVKGVCPPCRESAALSQRKITSQSKEEPPGLSCKSTSLRAFSQARRRRRSLEANP